MSTLALVLVLAAAVAHAAWNIIAAGKSKSGLPFLWWGAVFASTIWAGIIPLTGGLQGASWRDFLFGVAVSGVLHVVYMLVLQRGYAAGDLATVYATARGSGPILTVIIALALFGERPSPVALLGVMFIVLGVVCFGLISRSSATATRPLKIGKRGRIDPGVLYGLLTGVAIAAYSLWDAYSVNELSLPPVPYMVGFLAAELPFFSVLLLRAQGYSQLGQTLKTSWRQLLGFGIISPLSYILVLTANTMAPVSLVAPMREVSVVLVSLYGVIRFGQDRPVARVVAALTVVAGVVLIGM